MEWPHSERETSEVSADKADITFGEDVDRVAILDVPFHLLGPVLELPRRASHKHGNHTVPGNKACNAHEQYTQKRQYVDMLLVRLTRHPSRAQYDRLEVQTNNGLTSVLATWRKCCR